jgi:hypothetical protein
MRRPMVMVGALGLAAACMAAGCSAIGFFGALEESRRRNSTKTIAPQYTGLKGKQWAVVVIADRIIQADHPAIVAYITTKITERLADPKHNATIGATGYIPAPDLLKYLYEHPRWVSMPRAELARELGVDRLIVVDLEEYRLNDPGNQYIWAGNASGAVGVIEVDAPNADEFSFEKPVKVKFPDKDGYGPQDLPQAGVATTLANRFIDRASWLFYSHEEPYYPDY